MAFFLAVPFAFAAGAAVYSSFTKPKQANLAVPFAFAAGAAIYSNFTKSKQADKKIQNVLDELKKLKEAGTNPPRADEAAKSTQTAQDMQTVLNELAKLKAEAKKTHDLADAAAHSAKEAALFAQEAERRMRESSQTVLTLSPEEIAVAKQRIQYDDHLFHFAVAGVAGSGKSSLINAIRGYRNRDPGAAAAGIAETTREIARYPDSNPDRPFVWYDIPGACTLSTSHSAYFTSQCLYAFDCVIVLFDNRFTITDIAILMNCQKFGIPAYIVRSKADQRIRDAMRDMGYDESDEEDVARRESLYQDARQRVIKETQKTVASALKEVKLADQRVYVVSNEGMLGVVQGKKSKKRIDELDLLEDLFSEAQKRQNISTIIQ